MVASGAHADDDPDSRWLCLWCSLAWWYAWVCESSVHPRAEGAVGWPGWPSENWHPAQHRSAWNVGTCCTQNSIIDYVALGRNAGFYIPVASERDADHSRKSFGTKDEKCPCEKQEQESGKWRKADNRLVLKYNKPLFCPNDLAMALVVNTHTPLFFFLIRRLFRTRAARCGYTFLPPKLAVFHINMKCLSRQYYTIY